MDEKPRQELVDLISRIDAWGRSAPERLVHQSDAASLTWGDLIRRSDALAGAIASSGLRPGSPDDLPIVGPLPSFENVVAATGHFRNGILLGPLTGAWVARGVTSGDWSAVPHAFSPARFGA